MELNLTNVLDHLKVLKKILEETPHIFLYRENENLIFMNNDTFEQISVNVEMIGDQSAFLQDGMKVIINIYNDAPVSINMPDSCIEEIIEADAVIKVKLYLHRSSQQF